MRQASLAVAIVCAAIAGCGARSTGTPSEGAGSALIVRRGTLEDRFVVSGELEATTSENLRPPQLGSITIRWLVEEGALVKKGDRVVEFDAESFTTTLTDKRLAVQRAETDLAGQNATDALALADKQVEVERKRVALEKARVDAAVPQELRARRDFQERQKVVATATDDLRRAESDLAAQEQAARLDRRLKDLALARTRRDLKEVEGRLDDLVLTAPRDGLVQIASNWRQRKYQVGDIVWGGLAIAVMPDLSLMQVRAHLTDVDEGAIKVGMKAECVLDTYPTRRLPAIVKSISPVARPDAKDSIRKVFDVVVALEGQGLDPLVPGMSARVEVIRRRVEQGLVVPRTALHTTGDKTFARLATGRDEPVDIEFCALQECVVRKGPPEGTSLAASATKTGGSS